MVNKTHIKTYVDFVNKSHHSNHTLFFITINNICYLFYNENFGFNANNIGIKFTYDGINHIDNDIYYHVGFHLTQIDEYKNKLQKYNIIIINENEKITNFYQRSGLSNQGMLNLKFSTPINNSFGPIQFINMKYKNYLSPYIDIDGKLVNMDPNCDDINKIDHLDKEYSKIYNYVTPNNSYEELDEIDDFYTFVNNIDEKKRDSCDDYHII